MNASSSERIDPRRPVDRFLGNYAEDHRNPTNRLIHWICVPAILWTVIALLWVVPVPAALGRPGLWAALAAVAAMSWYLRLSIRLGLAMLVAFVLLFAFTWWLHARIGSSALMWSAIAVFVVSWVAQFIGHHIEGARPSFLTDLVYLLVGPLWLMSKFVRRLGISY
ncbi:MAG: Mpo1-like protein [Lysobacteraceae bacterium]